MGPTDGRNPEIVDYFSLEEYYDRIKLSDDVLFHSEDTSAAFDKYINELNEHSDNTIISFLIECFRHEIKDSNLIENHLIDPLEINKENIFFDSLKISNKRIKELHQFATRSDEMEEYRKTENRVSYYEDDGTEVIFWRGVQAQYVQQYMDDYIKLYKQTSLSNKDADPFIKSALMHLLFVRIHPFSDGNGRTARLVGNMKFTNGINRIYGSNLKISPLHLSQSILVNKPTYVSKIDNIYFDLEHDSNNEINKFLDFNLFMADEQIYYLFNKLLKNKSNLDWLDEHPEYSSTFKNEEKGLKGLTRKRTQGNTTV